MKLVEQHIIKKQHKLYKQLDELCFLSKNLYNAALYEVRQHYFKDKSYFNYYSINKIFHDSKNKDYYALPVNTSQETLKIVEQNYKSFFNTLKSIKNKHKVTIPKYLHKTKGRQVVIYNKMTLSKKYLEKQIIKLPKSEIEFHSKHCDSLSQVRIVPKNNYIIIEVVYNVVSKIFKDNNHKYLSIDLGVNNLATCTSNVCNAFIINGRPLKSINQYYNKKLSKLKSELPKNHFNSKRIYNLTLKRNNKIKDYLHKASKYIVNRAVLHDLNTIVIGKNNGWKQDTNMGKVNNQNFVSIPFNTLINMISYKAKMLGINVILQEESYTSKMSFFDNEKLCMYRQADSHLIKSSGKRIKRGLYKAKDGFVVNADVNGSLNILRKYLNVSSERIIPLRSRGFVIKPVVINI